MSLKNMMQNFMVEPTAQNEIALINELKKFDFFAPVIMAAPLANRDGSAYYEEEGSNIKFVILEDEESKNSFFPAFTSRDEMMKWRNDSEQEALSIRLKDYANILLDEKNRYEGIVIDPFSDALRLDLNFFKALFKEI